MASTALGGILESEISRSYNSFSGADIKAVIGPYQFAELQAISYSITREKAPVYCMGHADPLSYSRNKRGIAGSLIWINFDRHALLSLVSQAKGQFLADIDEIRPQYQGILPDASAIFASSLVRSAGISVAATVDQLDTISVTAVGSTKELASPWYSDQVLPFDITLAAANEFGAAAATKIFGVEILNEGWGTSIDDAVNEMQATFVARSVEPMAVVPTAYTGDGLLS
ncbi:MAG: hypothetical protein ACRYGG_16205 [Janthinobacterium lividum]